MAQPHSPKSPTQVQVVQVLESCAFFASLTATPHKQKHRLRLHVAPVHHVWRWAKLAHGTDPHPSYRVTHRSLQLLTPLCHAPVHSGRALLFLTVAGPLPSPLQKGA